MTDSYIELANVTISDKYHGELVQKRDLINTLNAAISSLEQLDKIKKSLFYGREYQNIASAGGATLAELPLDVAASQGYENAVKLIHGIIGVATEAGELLEALLKAIDGEELDVVNVSEELGDVFWYAAAILRVKGGSFSETQAQNIAKLRKRFPDGFSEFDANNRDIAAERLVLEQNQ